MDLNEMLHSKISRLRNKKLELFDKFSALNMEKCPCKYNDMEENLAKLRKPKTKTTRIIKGSYIGEEISVCVEKTMKQFEILMHGQLYFQFRLIMPSKTIKWICQNLDDPRMKQLDDLMRT